MKGTPMAKGRMPAGRWAALVGVALAAGLAAASCTTYSFSNPEPYIGPARPVPPAGSEKPAGAIGGGGPAVATPPVSTGPVQVPATGPITVTVSEAVLLAMANNQGLVVQKFNTPITKTGEENAAAVFDPDVTASMSVKTGEAKSSPNSRYRPTGPGLNAGVGWSQFFPSGTTVEAAATTTASFTGSDNFASRIGLTVTQAILRGYGADVNLVALRQARLDTLSSEYELRGFAESLVATVEETYWDYCLAQRNIAIFEESLKLAQKQLDETNERIKVGKLAEIERAAAEAEVALRKEALINARSALKTTRLGLLRLLNPGAPDFWSRDVATKTLPVIPADVKIDPVEEHVQVALRMRPDLNQARISVARDDLQLVKTKNGLLPQMNLFVSLGKTGYAESFGNSWGNVFNKGYDLTMGGTFEFPPENRDARATHQRATLSRAQAVESVGNVAQLIQVDVRAAYIEVERSQEQVVATAATRKLQQDKADAEVEKFGVGKSTTLLVAQAQRDLLQSQIDEVSAVVSYLKSMVELYRLEGTLLVRRAIECPGREPAEMPAARL
jgi:outer membrane protein